MGRSLNSADGTFEMTAMPSSIKVNGAADRADVEAVISAGTLLEAFSEEAYIADRDGTVIACNSAVLRYGFVASGGSQIQAALGLEKRDCVLLAEALSTQSGQTPTALILRSSRQMAPDQSGMDADGATRRREGYLKVTLRPFAVPQAPHAPHVPERQCFLITVDDMTSLDFGSLVSVNDIKDLLEAMRAGIALSIGEKGIAWANGTWHQLADTAIPVQRVDTRTPADISWLVKPEHPAPQPDDLLRIVKSPGGVLSDAGQAAAIWAAYADTNPIGILRLDSEGRIVFANRSIARMCEATDVLIGALASDILVPLDDGSGTVSLERLQERSLTDEPVEAMLREDHFRRRLEISLHPDPLAEGEGGGYILYASDIAGRHQVRDKVLQSQKLQAVGQLAGGIAHDFNNLLTAMIGFCDLLLLRHLPGDPSFADLMQIKQNVNRAANLVRQLLAFSRRQTLQPRLLYLPDVTGELSHFLRRVMGDRIELCLDAGEALGLVRCDQGQLEQVLVNLAVNARDAMPDGGRLHISMRNHDVDQERRGLSPGDALPAGQYVALRVADTGRGIEAEHLPRIFEPFFTTKPVGEGTGLGLATVYGIVRQTGGYIDVESKAGTGSAFTIYLPRQEAAEAATSGVPAATIPNPRMSYTGDHTVLLIEDEDAVRAFGARALRRKGYRVLEAANGLEALSVIEGHEGGIDIVVTDVVMPQMDGPTLVSRLHQTMPDLKVIYISGYAEEHFSDRYPLTEQTRFLAKPFSLKDLVSTVGHALNAPA